MTSISQYISIFIFPFLSYGKHFHPRKWSFSRQVTSTKLSYALSWIRKVPFDWKRSSVETPRRVNVGNLFHGRVQFSKRFTGTVRVRIENSVARAEMDANKSIGFPNEIKQARETFHPIDDRPPSSLFLFSTPPRWRGEKLENEK